MKLSGTHCLIASLIFIASAVTQLQAQTYTLGFDQAQYNVEPNGSTALRVILTEQISSGQAARLATGGDNGLFGFGLGLDFSAVSGGTNGSTFGVLIVDAMFAQDGTTNFGATDVSFEASENVLTNADGEFGVNGQFTSPTTFELELGIVTFNAGDAGSSTTVQAMAHVVPDANVFLFADGHQPTINYSSAEIIVSGGVPLKGDVNLSGTVNFLDIAAFIGALQTSVFQAEADCNCDGVVNFLDIAAFIQILQGP